MRSLTLRVLRRSPAAVLSEVEELALSKRLIQSRHVARALVREEGEDTDSRIRHFIASDETVDRYGDIIRVSGWELEDYNGSFLEGHDRMRPVGDVISVVKGKHKGGPKKGQPALLASVNFPEDDTDADRVLRRIDNGMLKSVSVSFLPLEGGVRRVEDAEERKRLGLGPFGVIYERQALLELSIVTVPANPNCNEDDAREMLARGLIQAREFDTARKLLAAPRGILTGDLEGEILGALKGLAQQVQELSWPRSGTPSSAEPAHERSADAPDLYELILSETRSAAAQIAAK